MIIPNVLIRNAQAKDIKQLIWDNSLKEFQEIIQKELKESLEDKKIYLVAEINEEVVGQIEINVLSDTPYLSALRVKHIFQNQGIGTQLILEAEKLLIEKSFTKSSIKVGTDNSRAKHVYEKLGYKIIDEENDSWNYTKDGEIKTFYETVYIMEKELLRQ